MVGWFLVTASRLEAQGALILHQLEGLVAADVMAPFPPVAPGWVTVQAFLEHYTGPGAPPAFLLQQWGGGVGALATLEDLRRVPEADRGSTRAIDVGTPLERLPVVGPGEPAPAVVRRLQQRSARWILVVDAGHIVGLTSERMLLEAAQRRGAAGGSGEGWQGGWSGGSSGGSSGYGGSSGGSTDGSGAASGDEAGGRRQPAGVGRFGRR